jgi:hypothetical protein
MTCLLAALALTLLCAQPVLAHCGNCGMGEAKQHSAMHASKQADCDDCQLFEDVKHDRKDGQQGKLKCDCAAGEHRGQHGMHGDHGHEHGHGHQGGDDGSLDELFETEKS